MTNFTPGEFKCRCGCGLGIERMDTGLLSMLSLARALAGIPFRLTSAIRCEAHNRRVGGKNDSAHLTGHAVDIQCADDRARHVMLNALAEAGFTRRGLGPDFIHVDNDPKKNPDRCWLYEKQA